MPKFNWLEQAEQAWDTNAGFWNKNSKAMWEEGSRSTILPFFKAYLKEGASVLDAGCGDGYGAYKLNLEGFRVTGMDLSSDMIEIAQSRSTDKLEFKVGDLSDLPFEERHFEGVMAINSLEWTEEPLRALNEIKRVLKPSGLLCAGILGPTAGPRANSFRRLYGDDVILNTMMPWEFQQLAEETGWKVRDGKGVYKNAVKDNMLAGLPLELKQALSFMWVFILEKE